MISVQEPDSCCEEVVLNHVFMVFRLLPNVGSEVRAWSGWCRYLMMLAAFLIPTNGGEVSPHDKPDNVSVAISEPNGMVAARVDCSNG